MTVLHCIRMDGMNNWPEEVKQYIQSLEEKIESLSKELEKVKNDFADYKKRHPPNTGVKHGKPYHFKSSTVSKKKKKPGAKKGHAPHYRAMPKDIDETRHVPVTHCPQCGRRVSENVQEIRRRVYEDIPVCQPIAVELLIERRYCNHCHKLIEAPVSEVLPNARIGLRTMLAVVWFKIHLRMTEEAIPQVFETLFGLHLSEGEVVCILRQIARVFGPYYQELIKEIRKAEARNIDETSWRTNGVNGYLWTFISQGVALFKIAQSRKHTVPLNVLGKKHHGVDIHDRFSAYKTLAGKTGNVQQVCWMHILKNAEELASFSKHEGEHILHVLRDIYHKAKAFDHQGTDEDINSLFSQMEHELNHPYKSHKCNRFVCHLLDEKETLFEFVKNSSVDGTNNAAERALRPAVIARKIMGGTRSEKGSHDYEILLSVIQTLQKNGKNLLEHGPEILKTSHG